MLVAVAPKPPKPDAVVVVPNPKPVLLVVAVFVLPKENEAIKIIRSILFKHILVFYIIQSK